MEEECKGLSLFDGVSGEFVMPWQAVRQWQLREDTLARVDGVCVSRSEFEASKYAESYEEMKEFAHLGIKLKVLARVSRPSFRF